MLKRDNWKSYPYTTKEEMDTFDYLASHILEDTIRCWYTTRINGVSACMVCDGNVSIPLIKELDKLYGRLNPTIRENNIRK